MSAVLCSYFYFNFGHKGVSDLTEAAAVIVLNCRECFYIFLIYIHGRKIIEMFENFMDARKLSGMNDSDQMMLTLRYCKLEFLMTAIFVPSNAFLLFLSATLCVYLFPNEYSLPINANFVFLPFEKYSFVWAMTYVYQLMYLTVAAIFFYAYFASTLILLNQTCWCFDSAFLLIKNLTKEETGGSTSIPKRVLDMKRVEEFVEFCCKIADWQDDVQTIMQFSLLAEITLLSSFFCLCFYNVSYFTAFLLFTGVSQLFLYCWFGTRATTKAEKLAAAIYDLDWHQLTPLQRKNFLILLTTAQYVTGLSAIFMEIDFETFQTILQFSYSLVAVLHSTI